MCSPASQTLINNVLDDFIGQGRAFTAFEVSIEAKKRGATERHRDMRAYIHQCACLNDELEFGNYQKTLVPVGGGNNAFLYHTKGYDPSQYVPLDANNGNVLSSPVSPPPKTPIQLPTNPQPFPMPTVPMPTNPQPFPMPTVPMPTNPKPFPMPADDDDDGSDIGHNLDHRNRLMVPTRFFRDLGVTPGERVKIVRPTSGGLFMIANTGSLVDGDNATEQVVERNGDLRLSLGTLLSAGLSGGNFQVETASYNGQNAVEVYNIDSTGNRL